MSAKMGRPTDNPKTKQLTVRLDVKCQEILKKYTDQEKVAPAEAVRRAIVKLESDIKK